MTADDVVRALRRRWWIVLLAVLLVGGASLAYSLTQTKQYSATASLLFKDDNLSQSVFGVITNPGTQDPARNGTTNTTLVKLSDTTQRAAETLDMSASAVNAAVNVEPRGESDVTEVVATDPSAVLAARIANAYARVFIAAQRNYKSGVILRARDAAQRELASKGSGYPARQVADLERQINQLQVLAALQTGGVQLVSAAEVPRSPSSPKTKRNVLLGIIAGGILGFGLVLLAQRLDRRIRRTQDLEREFGRPVLALLPPMYRKDDPVRDASLQEAIQLLRVSLTYTGLGTRLKVLLVTSSMPAEGKSTASTLIAFAAARAGSSVLLIEADLRRGALGTRLDTHPEYGLADVLARYVPPEEAVVDVPNPALTGATAESSIAFLAAGPRVPTPGDLIESERMAEVIEWARANYELVIVDTPPAIAVPDTFSMLPLVDGSLIIARLGVSRRDQVRRLATQLHLLNQDPIGIAVFSSKSSDSAYGYDYYGYSEPVSAPA